jgi:hypothetical protein
MALFCRNLHLRVVCAHTPKPFHTRWWQTHRSKASLLNNSPLTSPPYRSSTPTMSDANPQRKHSTLKTLTRRIQKIQRRQCMHDVQLWRVCVMFVRPVLYKQTNKQTQSSRGLLEKLTVSQLVKKFPAFYGTRRFVTAFTTANLTLSWTSLIQSMPLPTSRRSILILSSHLRLGLLRYTNSPTVNSTRVPLRQSKPSAPINLKH